MDKPGQRLPAPSKFMGLKSVKTGEPPEVKQIWADRLVFLLSAQLNDKTLKDVEAIQEILEMFGPIKGMTLADAMHMQQVLKAARGDTTAYLAIQKSIQAASEHEVTSKKTEDPVMLLTKMLYGALKDAGHDVGDDTGPIVIEAEVESE